MSMSLERVVARGTARSLINGSSAPSYEMVINLYKLLMVEGDAVLAAELLDVLASLDLSELDNSARVPLERIQLIH
jgi:hypothetical protein